MLQTEICRSQGCRSEGYVRVGIVAKVALGLAEAESRATLGCPKFTGALNSHILTPCPNQNSDFTFPSQLLILGTQTHLRNRHAPIFDILYDLFRFFTYSLILNITSPNIFKSVKKVLKILKIFEF